MSASQGKGPLILLYPSRWLAIYSLALALLTTAVLLSWMAAGWWQADSLWRLAALPFLALALKALWMQSRYRVMALLLQSGRRLAVLVTGGGDYQAGELCAAGRLGSWLMWFRWQPDQPSASVPLSFCVVGDALEPDAWRRLSAWRLSALAERREPRLPVS